MKFAVEHFTYWAAGHGSGDRPISAPRFVTETFCVDLLCHEAVQKECPSDVLTLCRDLSSNCTVRGMSLVPPITYPLRRVSHLQHQVSCFKRRWSSVVTQTTVILTRLKMGREVWGGTTTGCSGLPALKWIRRVPMVSLVVLFWSVLARCHFPSLSRRSPSTSDAFADILSGLIVAHGFFFSPFQ